MENRNRGECWTLVHGPPPTQQLGLIEGTEPFTGRHPEPGASKPFLSGGLNVTEVKGAFILKHIHARNSGGGEQHTMDLG